MKKVLGIMMLTCICILLGLSIDWSREKEMSLVDPTDKCEKVTEML